LHVNDEESGVVFADAAIKWPGIWRGVDECHCCVVGMVKVEDGDLIYR
jgi:hypothetical protein